MPTRLSPSRLRPTRLANPSLACVEPRADEEVMHATPGERHADEGDLHEQHLAVPLRPEIMEMRQPDDAEVRAGGEHDRDQHRRQPREAEERHAPELGRAVPDQGDHRREPADPERGPRDVNPVGGLREP